MIDNMMAPHILKKNNDIFVRGSKSNDEEKVQMCRSNKVANKWGICRETEWILYDAQCGKGAI